MPLKKWVPALIAGVLVGLVLALAAQSWWGLLAGIALCLPVAPLAARDHQRAASSRKQWDDNFRD